MLLVCIVVVGVLIAGCVFELAVWLIVVGIARLVGFRLGNVGSCCLVWYFCVLGRCGFGFALGCDLVLVGF